MKTVRIEVTEEMSGTRLDLALLAELQKAAPRLSRASLKTWFKAGHVLIQNRPAQPSLALRPGTCEVTLLRWEDDTQARGPLALASPQGSFLPIVYEDETLLVLHKLSGVPSVPQEAGEGRTAVGAALAHLPELASIGRGGYEPAILHRLDTGTSGLIVFAKTAPEFDRLLALWREGHVRKTYRALTRIPPERAAETPAPRLPLTIDFPLGHDVKSARRMIAIQPDREREIRGEPLDALTRVLGFREIAPGLFEAEIEIVTGVMHQIRCHLAAIGWPLLGDDVYRGVPSSRLWLHAWRLEIPLALGQTLKLEAALPPLWPRPKS